MNCKAEVAKFFREKLDNEDKIVTEKAHKAKKKINPEQSSVDC